MNHDHSRETILLTGGMWLAALVPATVDIWIRLLGVKPKRTFLPGWSGWDVAFVLLITMASQSLAVLTASWWFPVEPAAHSTNTQEAIHPLILYLQSTPTLGAVVVCMFSAVVVAPVVEEYFFRVLLLGWLEQKESLLRQRGAWPARIPQGLVSAALSALVFGLVHWHTIDPQGESLDSRLDWVKIAVGSIASAIAMAISLVALVAQGRANRDSLGWPPAAWLPLVVTGMLALIALLPAVYLTQIVLKLNLPTWIAPDPIPLFILGLGLALLYQRTGHILPCIVVHVLFNNLSLAVVWAQASAQS